MPAHLQSLDHHVGRPFEHLRGVLPQRTAQQHHRSQRKHQQSVHQQQAEVLGALPRHRRQGVVDQVTLPVQPGVHGKVIERIIRRSAAWRRAPVA